MENLWKRTKRMEQPEKAVTVIKNAAVIAASFLVSEIFMKNTPLYGKKG